MLAGTAEPTPEARAGEWTGAAAAALARLRADPVRRARAAQLLFGLGTLAALAVAALGDDPLGPRVAPVLLLAGLGLLCLEAAARGAGAMWSRRGEGRPPAPGGTGAAARGARDRATAEDVARDRLDEQLRLQALQDPLTNLANRALLRDRVQHALAHANRHVSTCAVLALDIDDFRTLNEGLGHSSGDLLLAAVARRLRRCLRPEDTAARLGGDEFAVLLEQLGDVGEALQVAQRILDSMHIPFEVAGQPRFISLSIGIAHSGQTGMKVDQILGGADIALHSARRAGRGHCVVYEPGMHQEVLDRATLENDLRAAERRGELRVHYQPEVDLVSGRILAVEALVRWQHPVRGLVPPDRFVPLAEETRLISAIDEWVMRTAAAQAAAWNRAGLGPLRLSVNVSAGELTDDGLVARVAAVLADTGLEPGLLELEVTESTVAPREDALTVLTAIRALGVRVAIDDFGVGYSMFSRLQRFPIDKLKIDRSFVAEINGADEDVPILAGIIALGHSMGLEVLAEGIETEAQRRYLRRVGCEQGQGFLFSRPVEAEEVEGMLGAEAGRQGSPLPPELAAFPA
ncbi:MAG TPA: EAL domain-containing protein [Candidatus Dormibacteraeota bacterium]|nr:EAL domain-containing protein [Candidatus Dormibacteraeota bacterium]